MKSLAVIFFLLAGQANAACRQALVFALDVSSSVDAQEYALQMQGLAGALLDPEVQALLLSQPSAPIDISVFEWSGRFDQRLVIDWTSINSAANLASIAAILSTQTRPDTTQPTAIGTALKYAGQMLAQRQDCWRLTVDISGDGKNNDGFKPKIAKQAPLFDRITVNGLVIGADDVSGDRIMENEIADLSTYFSSVVIHGPDAFIETALGFQDFQAAMKRKLLREAELMLASD
jgi:uncharacterized protein DUF1194